MAKLETYPVGVPVSGDLFPIDRHGRTMAVDYDNLFDTAPSAAVKVQFFDPTPNSGGGLAFDFDLFIPNDYLSLVSVKVGGFTSNPAPIAPVANISNTYGKAGEIFGSSSESDPAFGYLAGTKNAYFKVDVSSIFTNIEAGDLCKFNWQPVIGGFNTFMMELKYNA